MGRPKLECSFQDGWDDADSYFRGEGRVEREFDGHTFRDLVGYEEENMLSPYGEGRLARCRQEMKGKGIFRK